MDVKPRKHHPQYIALLRAMTPAQRLEKAFELSEYAKALLKQGLRNQHPECSEEALHGIYLARMRKCHNVNY